MEEAEIFPICSHLRCVGANVRMYIPFQKKKKTFRKKFSAISEKKHVILLNHIVKCVLGLRFFCLFIFCVFTNIALSLSSKLLDLIFEAEIFLLLLLLHRKKTTEGSQLYCPQNQSNKIQKVFSFLELLKFITSKKQHIFLFFSFQSSASKTDCAGPLLFSSV